MPRKLAALLISLFAVAFAFAAMAAIRWPSIILLLTLVDAESLGPGMADVNWRELGIQHGLPYFFAAMSLYAASALIAQRRGGAVFWYLLGCLLGFPIAFLVDFEPGWWRDPSAAEGAVAGAGVIALLLAIAVWDLRKGKPLHAAAEDETQAGEAMVSVPASMLEALAAANARPVTVSAAVAAKPRNPPSAMVMAQRAHYAREGRKMLARQAARRR